MQTRQADSVPAGHSPTPTATLQVKRFRCALDWLIALPSWETDLSIAAADLGIPAKRQGIGQAAALRSLPIERKHALVRQTLSNLPPAPQHAEAIQIARLLGISTFRGRSDFGRLAQSQWSELTKRFQLRLSQLYLKYKDAQTEIYAAYATLPEIVAASACRRPTLLQDATQEARLALLDAIDHISEEGNFRAYAQHWIKRRIQNFMMRSKLPVKAPINLISRTLRSRPDANLQLQQALREGTLSLDEAVNPGLLQNPLLATQHESHPDQRAQQEDLRSRIQFALAELTEKQREVVELRFGLHPTGDARSLSQIASLTGISRQQVHQREKRALQKLSQSLGATAAELEIASP